ncbi:MAG: hypothetical protein PHQ23_11440, partial [Candidatus Wallbacteria bacterium]|nr:hypothetical protein [Candidatus Wallbacteria bacterium]
MYLKTVKKVYRKISGPVKFTIVSEALVLFAFEIINPYLSIYFKEILGGSEAEFGVYNSLFYFLMFLGSLAILRFPHVPSKIYLNFY